MEKNHSLDRELNSHRMLGALGRVEVQGHWETQPIVGREAGQQKGQGPDPHLVQLVWCLSSS